ncbi:MAG TPA: DUF6492 family protein [Burkholderiales bacterium]|nr:DUF6492 family protein [Burkholderiales bacterium]
MNGSLCLLTPTWSGDKAQFDLLRTSIEQSALASARHDIVVQTEDLDLFRSYAGPGVRLLATEDVLPGDVEAMRQSARRLQARFGRAGTRILSSVSRYAGRPRWVRYTGWQVQQITKLAMAARSDIDTVVLLDSDVIVTRHARDEDFLHPGRIVCFGRWTPAEGVAGKVAKWNRQAHVLLGSPFSASAPVDTYFDTPFVFHAPTVREMLAWLERRYGRAWWEVLLAQPPRRWSEFATYRAFLRSRNPEYPVEWRSDRGIRYLFDARDPHALRSRVASLLEDSESHYIIIHSQSSGRQLWRAEDYAALLRPMLEARQ